MGTYLARPRATRRRPRPSAEPVCPRPPGRPGADGRRLPVTHEPRQSSAGQRKLQPPARAPAPLAEAAVRSREAPPRQTGLWCEPSCRGLSPAGPLHPPGPPAWGSSMALGGRAARAGTPSTQSPGWATSPNQTGASGAGRRPLQGRDPIPSAWTHLGLLCPSPHTRDSSAGGHMDVEVKRTQLGSGGAPRPAQCVPQLCGHPRPASVPPGSLQSSTTRESTSGPGGRAGLAGNGIPTCQGPGVQRIISLGPVLAQAHPHTNRHSHSAPGPRTAATVAG